LTCLALSTNEEPPIVHIQNPRPLTCVRLAPCGALKARVFNDGSRPLSSKWHCPNTQTGSRSGSPMRAASRLSLLTPASAPSAEHASIPPAIIASGPRIDSAGRRIDSASFSIPSATRVRSSIHPRYTHLSASRPCAAAGHILPTWSDHVLTRRRLRTPASVPLS
jgi:hypothetical protein